MAENSANCHTDVNSDYQSFQFPSYQGTELLRDAYVPGAYLTIDRWSSEEDFRAFRKDHDQQYETLDRACDALTSRETRIGAYTG